MQPRARAQDVRSRWSPTSGTPVSTEDELRVAVLVVCDDEDTCWAAQQRLSQNGYPSVTAASAEEALELLRRGVRPAIALIGSQVQCQDGSSLVDAIRATHRAPITIVSMPAGFLDEEPESLAGVDEPRFWPLLLALVEREYGLPT
jgi:CheY-like chemotaxis protein